MKKKLRAELEALMGVLVKFGDINVSGIRYLPRSVVVLIDVLTLCVALGITYFALYSINLRSHAVVSIQGEMAIILAVNLLFFYLFKTYAGLIRHSSFMDIAKLTLASLSTLVSLAVLHYVYYLSTGDRIFLMPGLLLYTPLSFSLLLIFRVCVKQVYHNFKFSIGSKERKRVLILGVDDDSIALGRALTTESSEAFQLVGFLSEKASLKNARIGGSKVFVVQSSLKETLALMDIDGVMIVGKNLSVQKKNEVVNDCLSCNLQVYSAPQLEEWNSSKDVTQHIKEIEIEELLDRDPIHLEAEAIKEDLTNKTILITGAAGSIGSELVRQIARFKPSKMILVDQAETPLYTLELEMRELYPDQKLRMILANVSNKHRMKAIFEAYDISVVYHAAAYKHVPMIENNPREAVVTNVLGTINCAELASEYKVSKFVMVSTDKAVNPTNVMGASKRAAEMYVQSFQNSLGNKTQFITTRFGNVLGSNGSVIPYFKQQIAKGGPVTVTHQDIIRYFMTIPEACQLVLQAGTMGNGGEIFVFDMGEPVRIMDLAERMIKLSGFIPYEDIDIKVTGLRPGEKLYEELLSDSCKTLPTPNKKIMVAKDQPLPFPIIHRRSKELIISAVKDKDKRVMVKLLKKLVPEFISQNSQFEALDDEKEGIKVVGGVNNN